MRKTPTATSGIPSDLISLLAAPDIPNRVVPSALLWLPGSLLAFIALGLLGALLGRLGRSKVPAAAEWLPRYTCTAAAATLLLIIAGGLVTIIRQVQLEEGKHASA